MIDLFEPRLPAARLHKSFRLILDDPACAAVMPVIQSWSAGLVERSREGDKFVKEFQSTFNSAMWELYLNKALTELGFTADFSLAVPDFCVTAPDGYRFNIEAVISDRGAGAAPASPASLDAFKNRCALKLIGKLKDKAELFRGSQGKKRAYGSLSHVRDVPFVVAIAPFDSDYSLLQNNELINLVLFGIGEPSHDPGSFGEQARVAEIHTRSGAPVEMGIFTNDSFREISAVIFSTVGTFGKAVVESGVNKIIRSNRYRCIEKSAVGYDAAAWALGDRYSISQKKLDYLKTRRWNFGREIAGSDIRICATALHAETHLDGLHIYYNPYAQCPLRPDVFQSGEITHNFYDTVKNEPAQFHPDGALVSRLLFEPDLQSLERLLRTDGFLGQR
ncbi:hypothetical protein GCM10011349_29580 [Novosphingobium indicum]|uniref:Glycosaminoglycan attachment site n=1 Tax=Novosphingobium indicum TaxID=462949 RepID=A0ABQ2JUA9_9SPHN|nr:hypothetical protein [Novosphingobium indicum]GGN54168.1 hypothetical protein GCM10011349_29580 [Novosphingobium indicum]